MNPSARRCTIDATRLPERPLRPSCPPAHPTDLHVPELFRPLAPQCVEMRQPRLRHILGQPPLSQGDLPGELAALAKQIAEMQPPVPGLLNVHIGPHEAGVNVDLRTEQSIYGPVK